MNRRLYLVDSDSLYSTAMAHYRGKLDFSTLMEKISDQSEEDFEAVVFHEEPMSRDSQAFQKLLKSLGFRVVVIPPRRISSWSSTSVPVHVAAYLFPRLGSFDRFDFISGDVDYSPLSKYLISQGKYVRLWLFSDRIPVFHQDEDAFNMIVPMNESFILDPAPKPAPKTTTMGSVQVTETDPGLSKIPELLERQSPTGCVDVTPEAPKVVSPTVAPGPGVVPLESLPTVPGPPKFGILEKDPPKVLSSEKKMERLENTLRNPPAKGCGDIDI